MTTPTHRDHAERLLALAESAEYGTVHPVRVDALRRATVHALLALAPDTPSEILIGPADATSGAAFAAAARTPWPPSGDWEADDAALDTVPTPRKRTAKKTARPSKPESKETPK
jgi:hypothetical protein